jgi:CBS domain-containing protein
MVQSISEVMTPNPVTLSAGRSAVDAAELMPGRDLGDVIVMDRNRVMGIVTDRDLAGRAVASGQDPAQVRLGDICSKELYTVKPTDPAEEVINLMREKAVRWIVVIENGSSVGIVFIDNLEEFSTTQLSHQYSPADPTGKPLEPGSSTPASE